MVVPVSIAISSSESKGACWEGHRSRATLWDGKGGAMKAQVPCIGKLER